MTTYHSPRTPNRLAEVYKASQNAAFSRLRGEYDAFVLETLCGPMGRIPMPDPPKRWAIYGGIGGKKTFKLAKLFGSY